MNREDAITLIEHYGKEQVQVVLQFSNGQIAFLASDFEKCERLPGGDLFEIVMSNTSKSAFSALMINSIGAGPIEQTLLSKEV